MVGEGGDPLWPAALPVDPRLPDRFPPSPSVSVPAALYPDDHLQGFVPSAAAAPVPFPCPEHLRGFLSSRGRIMWTEDENKIFETALLEFFEAGEEERSRAIAARLPGKTWEDVREHYQRLERDLRDIEAGVIPLPVYADKYWCHPSAGEGSSGGNTGKAKSGQRRKGIPWSEEEHSRFLIGLEKYEMGQWREISRFAVMTRTPAQVASHAQKYFRRLNKKAKKDPQGSSIHGPHRDLKKKKKKKKGAPSFRLLLSLSNLLSSLTL